MDDETDMNTLKDINAIVLIGKTLASILATVDEAFGDEVDYGQIVKVYTNHWIADDGERRYSPQPFVKEVGKKTICGAPDPDPILVGIKGGQAYLLATFDMTPLERQRVAEFGQ